MEWRRSGIWEAKISSGVQHATTKLTERAFEQHTVSGHCPLCGCPAAPHLRLSHTGVMFCSNVACRLMFAFPQLDDRDLAAAYRKYYYPDPQTGISIYENTPEEILRQTFSHIDKLFGPLAGKSLCDFGCGVGRLCEIARQFGMTTAGTEPDGNAREAATKSGSAEVFADLTALKKAHPNARFDIITMWDVIEHLRQPWQELQQLAGLLAPGGWLLLSTPNARCMRAWLERGRWVNMENPTHFYYFARQSLKNTLTRGGWPDSTELAFPIHYPAHSAARQLANRALVSSGLQGQLIFAARTESTPASSRPPAYEGYAHD